MAHIQIRIDIEEKRKAQQILEAMGLGMSGAIKLFLKKVIQEGKIPFEISANGGMHNLVAPTTNNVETTNGFSKRRIV